LVRKHSSQQAFRRRNVQIKVEELQRAQNVQQKLGPPNVCSGQQGKDLKIVDGNDQEGEVEILAIQNVGE
jgi:hypothetical protein